jgi:peroxiredoxin
MEALLIVARLLLASVFALAGAAKLADRAGSRGALLDFGVPAVLAGPLGLLLPLAELAVAAALVPAASAWWGGIGALVLLLVFLIGIGSNLALGRRPDCRCFGQLHAAPVGPSTLTRNAALAVVAAFVVLAGPLAQPSPVAWASGLTTTELLIVGLGGIGVGVLVVQTWLLFQIARQVGLLSRLDVLPTSPGAMAAGALPGLLEAAGRNGQPAAAQPRQGLPVGASAPEFSLPSLEGPTVSLAELRARGRPVLLLFMDPNCGPCTALLPHVASWQRRHAEEATIAVLSRGELAANRAKFSEHGVASVLLQREYEVADAFRAHGTPAAVLVRVDGTIGSPVALGSDQIRTLVWTSVLTPLPFVAPGAKPRPSLVPLGAPAPALRFSDLAGGAISLADLRGSRTVLLFWSNSCSFCQRMLADLKAWDAAPPANAPALLVVSDGTPEQNRALGLRSRVVIDEAFAAGKAFGANGTPTAVLLDADGKVASDLAVGADAVLALASAPAPAQPAPA